MAYQAFLVLVGRRLQIQNSSDTDRNVIREHLVGTRVLVLSGPDAVFVLGDMRDVLRLDAAMTTAGGASAGAVVLAYDRILGWG
jgi:hypothetical protein